MYGKWSAFSFSQEREKAYASCRQLTDIEEQLTLPARSRAAYLSASGCARLANISQWHGGIRLEGKTIRGDHESSTSSTRLLPRCAAGAGPSPALSIPRSFTSRGETAQRTGSPRAGLSFNTAPRKLTRPGISYQGTKTAYHDRL